MDDIPSLANLHGLAIGAGGFLLGLAACALMAIIEYGAWALVVPPRVKATDHLDKSTDPERGHIAIKADDGTRLSARWHPITNERPTGRIAVLIHGFAEAAREVQAIRVAALNAAGWEVAAIDLRGYGQSDGAYASFGGREGRDVVRWLDALARMVPRDDPADAFDPILWGRSMGAAIAIRAAAEDPRIRAVVLESPMVDLNDAMRVWFRSRRFPGSWLLARLVTMRAARIARVSLTRPRPIRLAGRVNCPVLILHGQADRLVSTPAARRLAAAFPTPARVVEVPEAGHVDVVAVGGEALLNDVVSFLDSAMARAGQERDGQPARAT